MADERKYYVICADNCKFESMTKEQILTAIEQAISTGAIQDVDSGFVTKIKELNRNTALSFWVGTQAEYNALTEKADGCFYIITDDTTADDLQKAIEELQEGLSALEKKFTEVCVNLFPAEIVVNTFGGTVICTSADGAEIEGKEADDGWGGKIYTFNVPEYGEYTITSISGDHEQSNVVFVDTVKQYNITFEDYDDVFANNSWETIVDMCRRNCVPDTWKVGDYKKVGEGGTGSKNWYVYIIDKNKDVYADTENYAPVTFMLEIPVSSSDFVMNTTETNAGGWRESNMRVNVLPAELERLPATMKDAIREVIKYTALGDDGGDTTIDTTADKLFLFSEKEHSGVNKYAGAYLPVTQYAFYANGNLFGSTNSPQVAWTRDPVCDTAGLNDPNLIFGFCIRDESKSSTNYSSAAMANDHYTADGDSIYIAPCFCF